MGLVNQAPSTDDAISEVGHSSITVLGRTSPGRRTMREIVLACVLNIALSALALAQSDQDLRGAGKRTDEIITYG